MRLLGLALLAAILLTSQVTAQTVSSSGDAPEDGTRLVLLGTGGGPGGHAGRAGIASLLRVAGKMYLVDAGVGVSRQLAKAGVTEPEIDVTFFTHLHDDHTAGLPALMTFFHTLRGKDTAIIGPPRTEGLVEATLAHLAVNAEIRMAERPLPPPAELFTATDVDAGTVYSNGTVTVTAVENTHFHLADHPVAARNKSYSYRFETPDGVIVFTGDTGPSPAVTDLARGADILVSEMVSAGDIESVPADVARHMLEEHLSVAEAGKLAANAGVNTLILSHIRDVAAADVAEIRRHFAGKVIVGQDLDSFTITRGEME